MNRELNIRYISTRPDQAHITFERANLEDIDFSDINFLDLETTGLVFNKNKILLVICGNEEIQYVIDYVSCDKELLKTKLEDCKLHVGHNLLFDLPFLLEQTCVDFELEQVYDTMTVEQSLVKGTSASVSLLNTVKRRLGISTFDKGITKEFTLMSGTNPFFEDRHIRYAAEDILYLGDLMTEQGRLIEKYKLEDLIKDNNNMIVVASYMKFWGMPVNSDKWMKLYYSNIKEADRLEVLMDDELRKLGINQRSRQKKYTVQTDIFGGGVDVVNKNLENINYGSSQQVLSIFRHLGQPIPKSAKEDKDSIGGATIEQYIIDRPKSKLIPFLSLLLLYKDYGKKSNTFGKKWLDVHYLKGRIHASTKTNSTATGRLAQSSPNLQQIPKGEDFRSCFESENNLIWTADYSGAELKILASLSKDKVMLELLNNDKDVHGYVATKVLRYLKKDDSLLVDKNNNGEFRTKMKNVIFGLLYGSGVNKIAELLNISKAKAQSVYDIMGQTYPDAFKYLEQVSTLGVMNGYVIFESKYRQRRWFESVFKGSMTKNAFKSLMTNSEKSSIERYCKNTPIQGTNGQMIKLALINIFRYICDNKLGTKIVNSVHDEIVIEVIKGEEHHCKEFKRIMVESGNYFLDGITMEVEDNLGKCWTK